MSEEDSVIKPLVFEEYSGRSTVTGLRILKAQVQLPLNLANPWKRDANIDYSLALMEGKILMVAGMKASEKKLFGDFCNGGCW